MIERDTRFVEVDENPLRRVFLGDGVGDLLHAGRGQPTPTPTTNRPREVRHG